MTPKQRVLRKYPKAICCQYGLYLWVVYDTDGRRVPLSTANYSPKTAWAEVAWKIYSRRSIA